MEFSRHEYWSGWPFPSPGKIRGMLFKSDTALFWRRCESDSRSVLSDSLRLHELYSPWNSPGQNTGVGSLSLPQGIFPTQGLNLGLPSLQADSLPTETQEKPKNTGVGSLSLLQRIFPTQKLNPGLLHHRHILYCLSYREVHGYWVGHNVHLGFLYHLTGEKMDFLANRNLPHAPTVC